MTLKEVRAEALKLPAREREELAQQLLASLPPSEEDEEDPIDGLGKNPVRGGSLEENGARKREQLAGKRSIWGLGSSPVDCGVTDGSVNNDKYFYDVPDD